MPLPVQSSLVEALLHAMQQLGRPAAIGEQEAQVARLLNLKAADIAEIHEGTRTKFSYRLAWARTYLKGVGLLDREGKGLWKLSDKGRTVRSIASLEAGALEDFGDLFDGQELPEGLDEEGPEEYGEYPIDSVLIRQETRTVFEVVRRIRDEQFVMDPDFQRDFIWDIYKQSKLIESMVMRIPLPVFYLAERDDGKTVVVDGLQRLTTFRRYLGDEFVLKGLELAGELNGKSFTQLPAKLRNRLEDTQLVLYLIDPKVPEQAKLDIFERVNGGVPLTRQQMRNSIYNGEATRWLKRAVLSQEFIDATAGSLDASTMRDREFVNRFAAFSVLGVEGYLRGDMDSFLANALRELNRAPVRIPPLHESFLHSMRNNYEVFGAHAFRKHRSATDRRSVLNVAIFDVFSVIFARIPVDIAAKYKEDLRAAFFSLMENSDFLDAVSFSTNSTSKVRDRFLVAEDVLKGVAPHAYPIHLKKL